MSIFEDAAVDSIVLILSNNTERNNEYNQIYNIKNFLNANYDSLSINQSEIIKNDYENSVDKKIYFYYRELFKTSKISLDMIKNNGDISSWELFASDREYNSKTPLYMPIIIFNATNDQNYFGILTVEKYG